MIADFKETGITRDKGIDGLILGVCIGYGRRVSTANAIRGDSRGAEARRGAWFCRHRMERAADELGLISLAIAPMRLSIPQAFEPGDQP